MEPMIEYDYLAEILESKHLISMTINLNKLIINEEKIITKKYE